MRTNLKAARKAAGYTQEDVSKIAGFALGTLRRWEQGVNEPDITAIITLASLYNVTTDTLLGSKFMDDRPGFVSNTHFSNCIEVPVYKVRMGKSLTTLSPSDETFPVPIEMYRKHPKGIFVEVDTESVNEKLPRGCLAFVDPEIERLDDMELYAVLFQDDGLVFSQVHTLKNGIELIPASTDPTFESSLFDYNKEDILPINIIGKIVWHVIPFDWEY